MQRIGGCSGERRSSSPRAKKPVVRLRSRPAGRVQVRRSGPGASGHGPSFLAPLDEDDLAAGGGESPGPRLLLDTHVWALERA